MSLSKPITIMPDPLPRPESPGAVLAKNLVIARVASGMTQQELAAAADIARATIAQLEAGVGDPRLSTITALARAIGVAPSILLGDAELAEILSHLLSDSPAQPSVTPADHAHMRVLLESGMLKDRLRAARIGAAAARRAGLDDHSVVKAAIFCAFKPEHGVAIAAFLGQLDSSSEKPLPIADRPRLKN